MSVRKSIDRLLTAYQEELLSLDELRERMQNLRRREQADNAELQAIIDQSADRATYLRLAETLTTFLTRLRSSADALDVSERQRVVRLLVKEVLVGDDKIIIRHSIPLPAGPADCPPTDHAGATPATPWSIMRDLVATNPHLIAINLARRHGHQLAITAGLHMCRGDLILTIDADLQDPPELLGEMWRLMERGSSDVVYGVRRSREGEGLLKRGTAAAFYRIMQRASPTPLPVDAGDFRLMTRRVLDILNGMPEQHRYIRGMVGWIGLRQISTPCHSLSTSRS